MNRKIIISIMVGLIILLLIWLVGGLLKSSSKNSRSDPESPQTQPAQASATSEPSQQAQASVSEGRPRPAPESEGGKLSSLLTLSAAKILFYGKVVDQDGKPLSNVEVTGKTGSKVAFYTEEHRDYQTATDAKGLFSFDEFKGDGLVIELKKPGYKFASDHRNFLYSAISGDQKRHEPDQANPVVFAMFKSMGAEPMIQYETDFIRFSPNGIPLRIDLRTGKVVASGGDLAVTVQWEGKPDPFSRTVAWSAKIAIENGGIVEGAKDHWFTAPASGYQPSLEYYFTVKDRGQTVPKEYYASLPGGKGYARITLFLDNVVADNQARISLRVWLNPSGSRNLEYDPAKRITK